MFKYFKELENRYALTFLGFIIAIILGSFTLYEQFIADKNPNLIFEIHGSTNVLDVKEQVSNLSILFDGADIRKQNQSLHVITVRVTNPSSKDILQSYYDEGDPVGIQISNGKIIKADLFGATNDYLANRFVVLTVDEKTVRFSSPIFEAKQAISVKLLVLHKTNEVPEISPLGKIAGIPNIKVVNVYLEGKEASFIERAFLGSWKIQTVRILSYSIALLVFLILVGGTFAAISSLNDKRERKKAVRSFKQSTNLTISELDEKIMTQYIEMGSRPINGYIRLIKRRKDLGQIYKEHQDFLAARNRISHNKYPSDYAMERHRYRVDMIRYETAMSENRLLTDDDLRSDTIAKKWSEYGMAIDIDPAIDIGLVEVSKASPSLNKRVARLVIRFYKFLANNDYITDRQSLDKPDELEALEDSLS